jgi:hypothetical protein
LGPGGAALWRLQLRLWPSAAYLRTWLSGTAGHAACFVISVGEDEMHPPSYLDHEIRTLEQILEQLGWG